MSDDSRLQDERRATIWREAYASDDLHAVLAALYEQEINLGMQSFWDGGWDVWFGSVETHGFPDTRRRTETFPPEAFDSIVGWLKQTAEELYPVLRRHRLGVEAYV